MYEVRSDVAQEETNTERPKCPQSPRPSTCTSSPVNGPCMSQVALQQERAYGITVGGTAVAQYNAQRYGQPFPPNTCFTSTSTARQSHASQYQVQYSQTAVMVSQHV